MLFNSGFIYEITKDNPTSFFLNTELDGPYFNQQEVIGAEWLSDNRNKKHIIYADRYRILLCKSLDNYEGITTNIKRLNDLSTTYIYLGTFNLKENLIYVMAQGKQEYVAIDTTDRSKIYDNKKVNIFK